MGRANKKPSVRISRERVDLGQIVLLVSVSWACYGLLFHGIRRYEALVTCKLCDKEKSG